MCLRQSLAALAALVGTGGNQALDNRNSGGNTIGIDIDARIHGEDLSDSKGSSKNADETSSGNESKEDKTEKEIKARLRKRAKQIREDNERRWEAAKAKGNVLEYDLYDQDDIS